MIEISCNHRVTGVVMNFLQFDAQWFEWKIKLHTDTKWNTRFMLNDLSQQRMKACTKSGKHRKLRRKNDYR